MKYHLNMQRTSVFLGLLVILAITLTLKLALSYLSNPNHFPLSVIKVVASYKNVDRYQIEKIITPYTKASFFSFDSSKMRFQIGSIDWVKQVTVERIWPDGVKITIKEFQPFAVWNESQLLSRNGHVFASSQESSTLYLPKLFGPENECQQVLQTYLQLNNLVKKDELTLAQVRKSKSNSWQINTQDGLIIKLGSQDPVLTLERLMAVFPSKFKDKLDQIAVLDLRYPHGIAVSFKNATRKQQ